MQWTGLIGMALGLFAVTGVKLNPPPVMLDVGTIEATPVPTPKPAEHKRLITLITVQNNNTGESVITFEASDFSKRPDHDPHIIASKQYAVGDGDDKKKTQEVSARIISKVRDLERDMLEFAKIAGPPKARAITTEGGRPED